jgi:uncharacterized protein YacL
MFIHFPYYLALAILVVIIIVLFFTRRLLRLSTGAFFAGITGLIIGLLLGTLLYGPMSRLPYGLGDWLPFITTVILGIAFFFLFLSKRRAIFESAVNFWDHLLRFREWRPAFGKEKEKSKEKEKIIEEGGIIVDTSVIIDGRIENLAKTGFVTEKLIIPHFVVLELQKIADASDSLKRNRGRRGLEILKSLQREKQIKTEIVDEDYQKIKAVDSKLMRIAKERKAKILTTDYNLNRVAGISGIKVLNINELTNALKTVLLPGEEITVKVVQEGKEKGQGVGYLEDGTMLVVENGAEYIGEEVKCEVKRIFQTDAGKMFFVEPKK